MPTDYAGSFIIVLILRGLFIIGSDSRCVSKQIEEGFKRRGLEGTKEIINRKINTAHNCIVVQAGHQDFNYNVRLEVTKMLKNNEKDGVPAITSTQICDRFESVIKKLLNNHKPEDTRKDIGSTLLICSYQEDEPKLAMVKTRDEKVYINNIDDKCQWGMGGRVTKNSYPKICEHLKKNLKEDTTLTEAANIVDDCVRMAAMYAEFEKNKDDDNSVGGESIVAIVQDVNDEAIKELEDRLETTENIEGMKDKKISFYNFGKISESSHELKRMALQ